VWFLLDKDIVGEEIGDIKMKHFKKLDQGVIRGSSTKVYDVTSASKKHYDEGIMFTTSEGTFIAGTDGDFEAITETRYELPANIREASAAFRKTENLDQYMVVLKY
jgi:hypothetical protein